MSVRDVFRRLFPRRRHPRVRMRPYNDSEIERPEPSTVEHALEEGVLISEYAVRIALKNLISISAITSDDAYEASAFLPDARSALQDLAAESEQAAARIGREREWAASLDGVAEHVHDYRAADDENLRFRQTVASSAAELLREKSEDDGYLSRLIEEARHDAWSEIGEAVLQNATRRYGPPDPSYLARRGERLAALRADLRALRRS